MEDEVDKEGVKNNDPKCLVECRGIFLYRPMPWKLPFVVCIIF